jgi:hypothetical protein
MSQRDVSLPDVSRSPITYTRMTLTFRADYAVPHLSPDAEFLDVIGTKSYEFSSLLFAATFSNGFYPPPPLIKSVLKLVCNVNNLYVETSSLKTLKIMPRNLNEIVCS